MPESTYSVRVCAAVRNSGDAVLIVRDVARAEERLTLPGGRPKFGESLETALVREVMEETGYSIIPTEIAYVAEQRAEPFGDVCLEICFYADIVGAAKDWVPRSAGESVIGCLWLALDDPRLRAAIPGARLFLDSRKGQYLHGR